jgi:hypothetical protein
MRELVEQGIEINGKHYYLVLATGARKHGDFLFAHTPYWKKIAPTFEKIMWSTAASSSLPAGNHPTSSGTFEC